MKGAELNMDWIWIVLGVLVAITYILIFLIMASKKLHPTTPDEDDDQMEAISQYNEKRARRDAKRKSRDEM